MDNLFAAPVFLDYMRGFEGDIVVVSPDAGGVERARAYAKRLDAGLAIVDKRRDAPNQAKAMHLIGNVQGKTAIVLDDMVDTAGTMCAAGQVLADNGAREILACATHPVLSGPAIERMDKSVFSQILVTDTIPLDARKTTCKKIKVHSVAELLAQAIVNVHGEASVSVLFV